jgi:hypothetical protein
LIGFEDDEPDPLPFQEQLADRLLEEVIEDDPGNRQVKTPIRFTFLQDVVVKDELT